MAPPWRRGGSDWECTRCGTTGNWSCRLQCRKCSAVAPRPAGQLSARGGVRSPTTSTLGDWCVVESRSRRRDRRRQQAATPGEKTSESPSSSVEEDSKHTELGRIAKQLQFLEAQEGECFKGWAAQLRGKKAELEAADRAKTPAGQLCFSLAGKIKKEEQRLAKLDARELELQKELAELQAKQAKARSELDSLRDQLLVQSGGKPEAAPDVASLLATLKEVVAAIPGEAVQPAIRERITTALLGLEEWGRPKQQQAAGAGSASAAADLGAQQVSGGQAAQQGAEVQDAAMGGQDVPLGADDDSDTSGLLAYQQLAASGIVAAGDDAKRQFLEALQAAKRRKLHG